jgi:dTDP-4-amino-4,6-dideoxygalactose transaminase
MIKFLDITKQDKKIRNYILSDIKKIFYHNNYILGDYVSLFEKNFAKFCGSKYAIGCANGTDALTIALKILNLPKGSEVIIPAMTYCSTAFSIINANLIPILVDIDFLSPTININKIKEKITEKTRVIMPVHLYGSVVNINLIKKIIKGKEIKIIDDCSQAHGGKLKKNVVGSLADISCFSLYPGKNLGAYGDAGVITTNNKFLYKKIKNFRNLGSDIKFIHNQIGFNSRLDTIQAAILLRKLPLLNSNNKKRINISKYYDKNIKNDKIVKLRYSDDAVYHQYLVLTRKRNLLIKLLKKNNIPYNFHYPKAIHQLDALKQRFKKNNYINSERIAEESVSIPIDPNLSNKDLRFIVGVLNSF